MINTGVRNSWLSLKSEGQGLSGSSTVEVVVCGSCSQGSLWYDHALHALLMVFKSLEDPSIPLLLFIMC